MDGDVPTIVAAQAARGRNQGALTDALLKQGESEFPFFVFALARFLVKLTPQRLVGVLSYDVEVRLSGKGEAL